MSTDRRRVLKTAAVAAAHLIPGLAPAGRRPAHGRSGSSSGTSSSRSRSRRTRTSSATRSPSTCGASPGSRSGRSSSDDPGQGLSEEVLDGLRRADLVGARPAGRGHAGDGPADRRPDQVRGDSSLIALHSAHWSTPFVEAMYERTRRDAERAHRTRRAEVEVSYVAAPAAVHGPEARRPADAVRRRSASSPTGREGRGPPALSAASPPTGPTASRARCGS